MEKIKNKRFLSFTFDDGAINGARKVDRILTPYKATFYIVTGWVKPNNVEINDYSNKDTDHGSLEDWKDLSSKGHDIASHTVSHILPDDPKAAREYEESFDFIKKIHRGPYNFSFPNDKEGEVDLSYYDSVRVGKKKITYNSLENINLQRIISWGPIIQRMSEGKIYQTIKKAPLSSWTVLEMHSLDGEGLFPWPSKALKRLVKFVLKQDFEIKTVSNMVNLLKNSCIR